ncbi:MULTISPECIES: YybH family protein [Euryhalocaulis]|uniref:YybH family protein n=1 Tax=Euryhalocaulis TaxID=1712422 RepID=UPI00039F46EA|nr:MULTISPECIES: nuclear transport factor 2 family protein [Euryhalocaulis]MBA4802191.1 nuclear transport factor 2 family protein [Euryhalocaulis sp.]
MPIAADDEKQILELEADWLNAEREGRPQDVAPLLSETVEFWGPEGERFTGREAAVEHLAATPGRILGIDLSEKQIWGGQDLAWKTARFITALEIDGKAVTVRGRHLWVLGREAEGWRVRLLCWELDSVEGG